MSTWDYGAGIVVDEICNMPAEADLLCAFLFGKYTDYGGYSPEDFYVSDYREIFNAAKLLFSKGEKLSAANLFPILSANARMAYATLQNQYLYTGSVDKIREQVKDASVKRRLLKIADGLAKACRGTDSGGALASLLLERAQQLTAEDASQDVVSVADILPDFYDEVERRAQGGKLPGLSFGYADLDALTGGMLPGGLYILGARPAMGKSAFASMLALHAASAVDVLFFSMEMSKQLVLQRMVAQYTKISNTKLKYGTLDFKDWETFAGKGLTDLARVGIYIDDRSGLSAEDVTYTAVKLSNKLKSKKRKLGLIVVDYLQIMGGKAKDRRQVVEENSRQLKILAKRLNCAVLVLSQLSRNVEESGDKRPRLYHLRETGAIEQDADLVAFLYREKYYNKEADDITEVIVAKQRDGELGTVRLEFDGETTGFYAEGMKVLASDAEWEQGVMEQL